MSRGTSRGILLTPDEEIAELQRHLSILEHERKTLIDESRLTSSKNKDMIAALQTEKDSLRTRVKEVTKSAEPEDKRVKPEDSEEVLKLRRKYDQLHSLYKSRQQQLKTIKDKLSEVPADPKTALTEEVPMNRQVRVLENRLDKAMIKYNEAQSIKKTYEQIVKQLKQERVAYENQLTAVERSLRGKDHDFEELLLLSHDAAHAKETAEAELCRFEAQTMVERLTRTKNVEDKKEEVQRRVDHTKKLEDLEQPNKETTSAYLSKIASGIASNTHLEQKSNEEKQKIRDYETAFRRIKEATGVVDVNEIIQKFGTQGDTHENLQNLHKEHQKKLDDLHQLKHELKIQAESLKLNSKSELESKKQLKDAESTLAAVMKRYGKSKSRFMALNKSIKDTMAGIEHISLLLTGVKMDSIPNLEITEDNLLDVLIQSHNKMKKIYFWVKENPLFTELHTNAPVLAKASDAAHRTAAMLKAINTVPELANTYSQGFRQDCRVRRPRTDEDEVYSEDPSEMMNESGALRDKLAKENSIRAEKILKPLRPRRTSSSVGKKRKY